LLTGLLDDLPQGGWLALGRLLDPAALAVLLGDRDRLEPREIVIPAACGSAVGIDAQPHRMRADTALPDAGPFGTFLSRDGRSGEQRGQEERGARHAANLSMARAIVTSRSESPPASWVVSVIATRL